MFNTDLLVTLSQAEVENTNLFPFPFGMHITFAVISLFFFVYRFFTDKKPYQIIFAFAVPLSLTLWASESRKWFYIIGAVELVLLLAAFISTFFFKSKPEVKTVPAAPAKAEAPAAEEEAPADDKSEE